jgi:hypothetical protein
MKKKVLTVLISILTIASFFVFNWHLGNISKWYSSQESYFIHRLITALWFVIPGFSLELPRLWPYFTGKVEAKTDWFFLLVNGIPALFFAWLPFFVTLLHLTLPVLIKNNPLPAEAIGAFWLGITLGKALILDQKATCS